MARYRITTPDGKQTVEIEGPDDATEEELQQVAHQQFDGKYASSPVVHGAPVQAPADPEGALLADVGTGVAELGKGVAEGGANVLDHAADWVQSGLNTAGQATAGSNWGDALNGGQKNDLAGAIAPAPEGYGGLRGVGRFVGEAAATAPLAMLPGGAFAQGAAGGALLSNSHDAVGVGMDALMGAAGGYAGSKLLGGAAAAANPQVEPGLRTLIDAGVNVTPGQYGRSTGTKFGAVMARTEDRGISTPFVGDKIIADRNGSLDDFARAAVNRAVEPIGLSLPGNVKPGRGAVKWAGDKLSDAYDALLPNLNVTGDSQFLTQLQQIHSNAQTLAPSRVRQFNSIVGDLGRFWGGGNALSGDALKSVDTRLGERIRRFSSSQDADQQDLGDALQAVRDSVHDLAARQNPQYAGELQAINKGWKGLVQVEKASANSKASISPAGYSQAVRQSSDTARRRGYSRGDALNQDLSDAASDILPSEIADSGTAGRWQQSNIPSLIVGGLQLPAYAAAKAGVPLMTRQTVVSPALQRLLQQAANAAPVAAPAAIDQIRR